MIITVKSDEICKDEQILSALKNTYMDIKPFMSIDAWKDEVCRLLERAEPKKPIDVTTIDNECICYVCANCKDDIPLEPIDHTKVTYCMYCGQAIDWSEGD